jgi:tRNA (guanine9-N1)-methyltransferase
LEKQRELKRARKASSRGVGGDVHPAAVVVDLGFDDLMTEQEITSMHSQLGYVYSINRTAARPFSSVLHTSFSPENSPRLWTKMGKAQWQRWNRMWFTAGDVGDVARELGKKEADGEEGKTEEVKVDEVKQEEASASSPAPTEPAPTEPAPTEPAPTEPAPYADLTRHLAPTLPPSIPRTHKLVYLSADADEELTTLAADEVYVIGGIVDRNRHKVSWNVGRWRGDWNTPTAMLTHQMLCQNKAEGLGIRTARLPIGTYLANMPTRKVLTVNQVRLCGANCLYAVYGMPWPCAMRRGGPVRRLWHSLSSNTLTPRYSRFSPNTSHCRTGLQHSRP